MRGLLRMQLLHEAFVIGRLAKIRQKTFDEILDAFLAARDLEQLAV